MKQPIYGSTDRIEEGKSALRRSVDSDDDDEEDETFDFDTVTLRSNSGNNSPTSSSLSDENSRLLKNNKSSQDSSNPSSPSTSSSRWRSAGLVGAMVILIAVACVAVLSQADTALNRQSLKTVFASIGRGKSSDKSTDVESEDAETAVDPSITATDVDVSVPGDVLEFDVARVGYNPTVIDENILNYKFLHDTDTIIEPYASSNIWIEDMGNDVYYLYSVCSLDTGECVQGGNSLDSTYVLDFTLECDPFAKYLVTVTEYSIAGNVQQRDATAVAMCIYVRREVRTLNEADLSITMDAMATMWTVSEDDGVELYGDDYHDSSYLLKFHHFNAAWQDADHIHEGNGFLMQHLKMTNIFEKSLQSIEPSIALPYWDFTIDDSEGKAAHNSIVMTSLMFGSMTQPLELSNGYSYAYDNITMAAIPDGRWAYLKAEMNDQYDDLKAGYGYMRAPWNMNPSPYVSRFTMDLQIGISLPTCAHHFNVLTETDMMDFMYNIQYDPHATTHSLAGGIYGCDLLQPLLDAGYISDETNMKTICSKWIFYMKEFYRYNYIIPRSDCVVADDVQSSTCGFDCVDDTVSALISNLKTKIDANVPDDMSDDGWTAWSDFLCTGDAGKIFSGDHLESASPADPSFWVIHPTLERLLHAKLMAGGFEQESWDSKAEDACDKYECYRVVDGVGAYDDYDECCEGHFENSQLYDAIAGNRSTFFGSTNNEMLTATDPRSMTYSMPYIYDTFTWNHCPDDFWALIETLSITGMRKRE